MRRARKGLARGIVDRDAGLARDASAGRIFWISALARSNAISRSSPRAARPWRFAQPSRKAMIDGSQSISVP
jgi:hypothetical protein